MQVFVPLSGLMDVDVEQKRVQKELDNKEKALRGIHAKLKNQEFLTRAPAEIVEREENRKAEIQQQIEDLKELAASLEEGN